MHVKFWGTRGSIPTPGPGTNKFGGNTPCIEVRTKQDTLIILDCGSGLRCLGEDMLKRGDGPFKGHIFISHTHWDHIQGVPFFAPFFMPGCEWDIYAPKGLVYSIREALAGQMQHTYFPITLEEFDSNIRYHQLVEGTIIVEDTTVHAQYMNHTALTLGYRIEADGAILVYASDHEPFSTTPTDDIDLMTPQDLRHVEFLKDADLIIHDAQYTKSEYKDKIGWGHSPVHYVVDVSTAAKAKQLALFHHDPVRDDRALESLVAEINDENHSKGNLLSVFAATEGDEVELGLQAEKPEAPTTRAVAGAQSTAIQTSTVLVGCTNPKIITTLKKAIDGPEVEVDFQSDEEGLLESFRQQPPSIVLLDEEFFEAGGKSIAKKIRQQNLVTAKKVPIILLTSVGLSSEELGRRGLSDYVRKPFSSSYAKMKLHCWLLGGQCFWKPAPLADDEQERLNFLHDKHILDSEAEERFDKYTRIAVNTFNVPIALVSLIDEDRQWFKSKQGLDVSETPRDQSFCAHAVYSREPLIVEDTLLDDRFASSPLVTGMSRVRFYAGIPLILPNGVCVGSFCIVDVKPREFSQSDMEALEELSKGVIDELMKEKA